MTTSEKTLFYEIVNVFPHITEDKFKESITKGGLMEAALRAMKIYAKERIIKASDVAFDSMFETSGAIAARKLKNKIIDEIQTD